MDALRAAVVELLKLNPDHGLDDIALAEEVMNHGSLVAAGFKRSERLRLLMNSRRPQPFNDKRHPVDYALDILEFDEMAREALR